MEKGMTTFYIARHGETVFNATGIVQGHTDSPLTENGVAQAQALGEELRHINFDAVFSSDLLRAQKTAEIAKLERELVVTTSALLRERSYGRFDGKKGVLLRAHMQEVLKQFEDLAYEERKKMRFDTGMESDEDLVTRLILFLRETAVAYPGKTALVVSHGASIRVLLIHLGWATYEEIPDGSGAVSNTGYVKILCDGTDFKIEEVKGIAKREV
jgi:alpha-ribazole phosphatase